MASLTSARKKTKREDIKKGTIFYVKWDMEDGSSKYFKAIATGENKGGEFEILYTQDNSTEIRMRSTIDDRSKTLISKETYNNTISAYPPKKPSVGDDYQVGELPQMGTNNSNERALSMVPLTDEEIMRKTPLTNLEAKKDMHKTGMSQKGYGRKTRRRKRRKSRKKRRKSRKKRRKSRIKTKKRRRSKKRIKQRKR